MDGSNKETSNFSLEPFTNDSDGEDENNKESRNDSSKDNTRSMEISDRIAEGLDEECDTEGELGLFYDVVPDAEESPAEDDAWYEWHEDHNKDSDEDAEESEHINYESNMTLPSIIITIEEIQQTQGKHLKNHLGTRGLPVSVAKVMMT